jgi:hypothetical protein
MGLGHNSLRFLLGWVECKLQKSALEMNTGCPFALVLGFSQGFTKPSQLSVDGVVSFNFVHFVTACVTKISSHGTLMHEYFAGHRISVRPRNFGNPALSDCSRGGNPIAGFPYLCLCISSIQVQYTLVSHLSPATRALLGSSA